MNRIVKKELPTQLWSAWGAFRLTRSTHAKPSLRPVSDHARSWLNGDSAAYFESSYVDFTQNPRSVSAPLRQLFEEIEREEVAHGAATSVQSTNVKELISQYQAHGHRRAKLDPLGYAQSVSDSSTVKELESATNMDARILDKTVHIPNNTYIGAKIGVLTLRELLLRLDGIYCGPIGTEFTHLTNPEEVDWIKRQLEVERHAFVDENRKKWILQRLAAPSTLESFLEKKYSSEKRFGLEGCEALIPCLDVIVERCSQSGVQTLVMGMPHRGRLNVLANTLEMPLKELLALFDAKLKIPEQLSGDVKYHLGFTNSKLVANTGKKIELVMLPNPSHLETVNSVVLGRTCAEQFHLGDTRGDKVASILIHGDAAFAGQGVVSETLQLSGVSGYSVGGTIHVVVNNQVGFTTNPDTCRSSAYCTDVARTINAPVFHVNADDAEAVTFVSSLAAEWRAKFRKDVVIDLVCYRRRGHNEVDEPSFTQPAMYKLVTKHPRVFKLYADKLIKEKVVDHNWITETQKTYQNSCEKAFADSEKITVLPPSLWENSSVTSESDRSVAATGVDEATLMQIGQALSVPPDGMALHRNLKRILTQRKDMLSKRMADWALGEAFAFGSLLKEGVSVRLSGQDVERGTFSHRHHILHDQEVKGKRMSVLNRVFENQAEYTVHNSILSEYGVLGFELGYSLRRPRRSLVCWEAQFGDFINTAQCIIDQYLSSGEKKWGLQTGLVLLLPHGYEGEGPEHSSARLERFLQSCDDDEDACPSAEELASPHFAPNQLRQCNWQVLNPTTPANNFHALRRQLALPTPKPLIMMAPKSLLRNPNARSSIDEMLPGKEFQRVIADSSVQNPASVKKLLLCSGKVYYDLVKRRQEDGLQQQIAIVRVEQLAPFPYDRIRTEREKFRNATVTWVQEEHKNMGAYSYVKPRMHALMARMDNGCPQLGYAGRAASAATATGNKNAHSIQKEQFLREAMSL